MSKTLSDVILHFQNIGLVELGAVHELALVGAACQLTEEVHQIVETGGTTAYRRKRNLFRKNKQTAFH